jgi:hypothetical protein
MAGTVDLVQRVSTGIEVTGDVLRLNPRLPEWLDRLDLRLTWHSLTIRGREAVPAPIRMAVRDEELEFACGGARGFMLDRAGTDEAGDPTSNRNPAAVGRPAGFEDRAVTVLSGTGAAVALVNRLSAGAPPSLDGMLVL